MLQPIVPTNHYYCSYWVARNDVTASQLGELTEAKARQALGVH